MRYKTLALVSILLLAALILPSARPPTIAQDGTPEPTVPQPAGEGIAVVRLPFGDTFDINQGWRPDGTWRYDTETAFDGSGWFLDGTQRGATGTLQYTPLVDLSGKLGAQLLFRQKGRLPASDLITLDLSLDGGLSWFIVDQQIGINTGWEQHIVDLANFRGQVVSLRLRVSTGLEIPPNSVPAVGYWVDNLAIQFFDPNASVSAPIEVVPLYSGPHTLLGLHLIVGARMGPVIELARQLRDAGRPMGTLKGTSGTENILNEVAKISPETIIVYRSLLTPQGMIDCPNTANDPVAEAQNWMDGLQPYWAGVQADYFEIMNECLPPVEWLVPFSIEAMRIASAQGQCLLMFSFATGNPDPAVYAQLLPVYEYALANPCRPGRYHGIALHAYGVNKRTLVSESGIFLGLRHRLFYARILATLPEAAQLPVFLTEIGPGDGSTPFDCEDVTRDVIQYTAQLEADPYIQGFHLWNLGATAGWIDFTDCLPMIGDALLNYYASQ